MKLMLIGKNGQLGQSLYASSSRNISSDEIVFLSREQLDINNFENTRKKILDINPDIVINASAYTNVDKAESEIYEANQINNLALKNISEICNDINSWIIHISTDYVFDGKLKEPYEENSICNPINIYGKTKLDGELAIKNSGCKYIIVRTSWLFGEHGNNFLKTMLKLAKTQNKINIIGDQYGTPTYSGDLSNAILTIVKNIKHNKTSSGLYHYGGDMKCSWYEFAKMIFDEVKAMNIKRQDVIINYIPSIEYKSAAERPKDSSLDSRLISQTFNLKPSNCLLGIKNSLKILNNSEFGLIR